MDFGSLALSSVDRIDAACDDFEAAWLAGRRIRVEDAWVAVDQADRPELLRALLALELELRRGAGERPRPEEYRDRFPGQAAWIDALFAGAAAGSAGTTAPGSGPGAGAGGLIPPSIGRYTVLSKLGEGGQGQVFRVVHPGLGRDLILKLAHHPVDDHAGRDRLLAEGRLLAELDHPNLVRVIDLDFCDGRPFVVMEYIAGSTLLQYAAARPLPPRRAAAVVADLARVVEYVHGHGVVHQDITPKNILIDAAGRPRLIDFGLAQFRHAWSDAEDGPTAGTLQFMAPEQARGEAMRVGPPTDVFALGGALYYLLTGRPPFAGRTAEEARARAARCDFDRAALGRRGIPRALARIVLRAMAADPADRYPRAGDLTVVLERSLSRPRRLLQATAVTSVVVGLAAMLALPARPGGRPAAMMPPPVPQGAPLRIEMMEVRRFVVDEDRRPIPRGVVGQDVNDGREGDVVKVRARLTAPAYCYLIALLPDGQVQCYFPEDEGAPPRLDQLVYPADPEQYSPLTDGIGLQAFVLLASERPLPSYREWLRRVDPVPWRPTGPGAEGVWQFDGSAFERKDAATRSEPRRLAVGLPPDFVATCRALAARREFRAIEARTFPVRPRSDPVATTPTGVIEE